MLNIDVGPDLLDRWRSWFAPDPQPFLVDAALAESLGVERSAGPLPDELRDTYEVYGLPEGVGIVWYAEEEFADLPRPRRKVLRVDEVKRSARSRGRRLHRYRLTR